QAARIGEAFLVELGRLRGIQHVGHGFLRVPGRNALKYILPVATDHFTRAAISSALRPACSSTLLVCSPRFATFGPLCTGDPEKRKGGAGDRYLPALSSIGRS